MKRKYYYTLFIILFVMSCKKGNPSPGTFTESSYPLAVGDWWQYIVTYCSGGGAADTITLSVVSMTNAGPYTNYKCYYLYHGIVTDSGYFQQSDTSMSFTNYFSYPSFGAFPNFHLKFPVALDQHWPGAYYPKDSIVVVGVVDSCDYGIPYGPCYITNEAYDLPHNFLVNTIALTPHLGLIKQSIDYVSDTADGGFGVDICQSFLLLNYHVQ